MRDPGGALREIYLPIKVRPHFQGCDTAGLRLIATDRFALRPDGTLRFTLINLYRLP